MLMLISHVTAALSGHFLWLFSSSCVLHRKPVLLALKLISKIVFVLIYVSIGPRVFFNLFLTTV